VRNEDNKGGQTSNDTRNIEQTRDGIRRYVQPCYEERTVANNSKDGGKSQQRKNARDLPKTHRRGFHWRNRNSIIAIFVLLEKNLQWDNMNGNEK